MRAHAARGIFYLVRSRDSKASARSLVWLVFAMEMRAVRCSPSESSAVVVITSAAAWRIQRTHLF